MLGVFDLIWIAMTMAGVAFFSSLYSDAEGRTQRVEARLDWILKHLGLDVVATRSFC